MVRGAGMFGNGDADPVGICQHFFKLRQGFLSLRIPVIPVCSVKNIDIVVPIKIFFRDNFIHQLVGCHYLGTPCDLGIVISVEIIHFLGRCVVQNETRLHLVCILVYQPAVDKNVLCDHQFGDLHLHGSRVVTQKKDHGLGLIILFLGQNPVYPV